VSPGIPSVSRAEVLEVRQRLQRVAQAGILSLQRLPLWPAALEDQTLGHYAKLLAIDQRLAVGVGRRRNEKGIDLEKGR